MPSKVCPVVLRTCRDVVEVLAFRHPLAGKQFVKGSIEAGESPQDAALRELEEESGITSMSGVRQLGTAEIGQSTCYFFALKTDDLPQRWDHATTDDHGHVFSFFWHPLDEDLDDEWHPQFDDALAAIRRFLRGEFADRSY